MSISIDEQQLIGLQQEPVLAVDLDGTLLRTDTLAESAMALLRDQPLALGSILLALGRGRAGFKAWVADRVALDIPSLPLNTELVDWLRLERERGRKLVLVTAADQQVADAVAQHTGLFDEVLASDGQQNLKAQAKADRLVEQYGQEGFDYAGDSTADIPVWRASREAIVVGGARLEQAAGRVADIGKVFAPSARQPATALRALRLHQWVKNLLVFLPLLAAHRITDTPALVTVAIAFIAFGLTASAIYLLNDLVDLPADRHHPEKCRRPFASGAMPISWALVLLPTLLILSMTLSLLFLPNHFLLVLVGYLLMTTAYSFYLKRIPIVDIMILAALYTIRVIAGAAAVTIVPSFWLLAFSIFIFLSLALVKRYTELQMLQERGDLTAEGRGWHVNDLPLIGAIGVSSGVASVLILALYIDSQPASELYKTPELLWFICPLLLYWISRLWFNTHRGWIHEDPVVFALRDRISYCVAALSATFVIIATVGVGL